MKPPFCLFLAVIGLSVSCGPSPLPEQYQVKLPAAPSLWKELLGEPHWRLEWYDPSGKLHSTRFAGQGAANAGKIAVLTQWPSAVLAWPYWPEKALAPGMFYPAGALYPFDVRGESIVLSWTRGVDAYFYREMDKLRSLNQSNRTPEHFDWERFRSLLREEAPEDLRADPWLADWKDIAEKTVSSGFRKSLIKAEKRIVIRTTLPHNGPWIWSSPFKPPESGQKGEEIPLSLGAHPEYLASPGGVLCISQHNQVWAAW
ncbi:MAG: hypothetical protein LBB72_06440 [Spirochaetaceae bacterium]|jgi:hypothetical protein|nr:hypothetical protein [Spirochaetaceae bacterium]